MRIEPVSQLWGGKEYNKISLFKPLPQHSAQVGSRAESANRLSSIYVEIRNARAQDYLSSTRGTNHGAILTFTLVSLVAGAVYMMIQLGYFSLLLLFTKISTCT